MSAQAFIDELRWRGLLTQVSDEAGLLEHLDGGRRTLYCGFDPTADSLQAVCRWVEPTVERPTTAVQMLEQACLVRHLG